MVILITVAVAGNSLVRRVSTWKAKALFADGHGYISPQLTTVRWFNTTWHSPLSNFPPWPPRTRSCQDHFVFVEAVGQLLKLPPWQRITLIAAGAGGGIAATFNTPVGGVLFAIEIVMHEVSARTLVPVITATVTAAYIGRIFFGPHPSFYIPALDTPYFAVAKPVLLAAYGGLGAITGLVSALFIWSLYKCEEFFEKHVRGGYYLQHMTGMLLVGAMMYALMYRFGHYYIEGVGYAAIQGILSSMRYPLYLLLLLFAAKLLATSLTLGSGASGGVFSPALFLGATSGASWGILLNHFFPSLHVSPAAFAVAGMGAVVGGSTGAAVAAIVMIFEMTLDYSVIIPITLTVAISYAVRRSLIRDSIYTRKLTLRGSPSPIHCAPTFNSPEVRRESCIPLVPKRSLHFRKTATLIGITLWCLVTHRCGKLSPKCEPKTLRSHWSHRETDESALGMRKESSLVRTFWTLWPTIWNCSRFLNAAQASYRLRASCPPSEH